METITTATPHVFKKGDRLVYWIDETRWWMKLAYALVRRTPPKRKKVTVVGETTETTICLS